MRTLLINPPYPLSEIPTIPMGLAYIAAVLERAGKEVQILDLLVSRYSREKIRDKIADYQPDIIGISAVTMNYPIATSILQYCKMVNKNITTVIGGPHVTFCPVETLNEAPWIDIVVRGEGEQTMLDIASRKKLDDIDGIAFRSDGIKLTSERRFIQNLDELPLPARHLFPLAKYQALHGHCSLITGRGCPFHCIFCAGPRMGGRKPRFRNPKLVVDEMEQVLAYGFKEINVQDDLLTVNHRHLRTICDEIITRGLKFNWSAFSRVDTVNPEILRKMKDAGCTWISYGVESGNQQILDKVEKKITLEKIRYGVKLAKEAGINVLSSFILGLPGETRETLEETVNFAEELETLYGFHVLAPCPGTKVREKAKEYGIEILTDDWSKYDANRAVTRTVDIGPEEISEVLRQYNEHCKLASLEQEKEGISGCSEQVQPKERSPLAWTLVQDDVIENLGKIKLLGDPLEGLVSRLAEILPYPYHQINESIRKWHDEGIFQYELNDGHLIWSWG